MNKIFPSASAALQGVVQNGQLMAVGGFGLCGIPEALIEAVKASGVKNLTDRKSTRLNSSHSEISRMPSSA